MVKHIASILSKGRLEIDCKNCVVNIIPEVTNSIRHCYSYSEINFDDWGYVYEKYVGQKYEEEGYQVEYLGLKNGFLDGGMDIIISKDDFKAYIQCKYSSKSKPCFGKQKIEWILYKASSFLSKQYKDQKLNFWLVVPTLQLIKKDLQDYFLSKNNFQDMVKLELKAIPMPL